MIVFINLKVDGEYLSTEEVHGVFGHRGRRMIRTAVRRLLSGKEVTSVALAGTEVTYSVPTAPNKAVVNALAAATIRVNRW